MKNKIKLSIVFILVSMLTFAQPNPDALPGEQDQFDAPVDANLICLVIIGLIFWYNVSQKTSRIFENKVAVYNCELRSYLIKKSASSMVRIFFIKLIFRFNKVGRYFKIIRNLSTDEL